MRETAHLLLHFIPQRVAAEAVRHDVLLHDALERVWVGAALPHLHHRLPCRGGGGVLVLVANVGARPVQHCPGCVAAGQHRLPQRLVGRAAQLHRLRRRDKGQVRRVKKVTGTAHRHAPPPHLQRGIPRHGIKPERDLGLPRARRRRGRGKDGGGSGGNLRRVRGAGRRRRRRHRCGGAGAGVIRREAVQRRKGLQSLPSGENRTEAEAAFIRCDTAVQRRQRTSGTFFFLLGSCRYDALLQLKFFFFIRQGLEHATPQPGHAHRQVQVPRL
ncbi:hypothetical protein NQL31_000813 [Lotmaria passim]